MENLGEELKKEVENASNEKINIRKEKIINWLKDPYNIVFLGLFIFLIIIHFYYFNLTKNQPLWWDESQYMSTAKAYAGIGDYKLEGPRLPGFPMLMSLFFILGITSEPVMRFIALLLPSLIAILLLYFTIKEMYTDKKIAIVSTVIFGVLWEYFFYSNRFHTETFSLIFEFLAIFILFKCYVKKQDFLFIKSKYSLIWILLFCIIFVLFRFGAYVALPAIFIFIIIVNKDKILTKKGIVLSVLFLIILIILGIYALNQPYVKSLINSVAPQDKIAWHFLTVFNGFYASVVQGQPPILLYFFIAGLIIVIFELFIIYERFKTISRDSKNIDFKSNLFNLILLVSVLFLFIFIMRQGSIEYRWFFPFLTAMLVFTSIGIIKIPEYILSFFKIKNKIVLIIIITIIVSLGAYNQLVHSDMIIKSKIDSYQQVKDAGLWIKQNSDTKDIIISASQPQTTYYSERKVESFSINGSDQNNETGFDDIIKVLRPRYVTVSIFEPSFTPKWAYDWQNRNNESVKPVMAFYLDQEHKQLALVIFEVDYSKFDNIKNYNEVNKKITNNTANVNNILNQANKSLI